MAAGTAFDPDVFAKRNGEIVDRFGKQLQLLRIGQTIFEVRDSQRRRNASPRRSPVVGLVGQLRQIRDNFVGGSPAIVGRPMDGLGVVREVTKIQEKRLIEMKISLLNDIRFMRSRRLVRPSRRSAGP